MPRILNLQSREAGEVTILTLSGSFVQETANPLSQCVNALVEAGRKNFLLGLDGVTECDDAGIGCLIAAYTAVVRSGGVFRLVRPSLTVREKFLSVHFVGRPSIEKFFGVYLSEADALVSFDRETK